MTIPIGAILESINAADKLLDLGGRLVSFMKQRHPELNTAPVPDEAAAMDEARAAALQREKKAEVRAMQLDLADDPDASTDPDE